MLEAKSLCEQEGAGWWGRVRDAPQLLRTGDQGQEGGCRLLMTAFTVLLFVFRDMGSEVLVGMGGGVGCLRRVAVGLVHNVVG